jgi:ADP-heptose:LPS heptosyltransferase
VDIATLPAGIKNGYIGWAIGAKQHTKQMPTSKVIETIKMLHLPIVLLGGSEDAANAEHICNSVTSVPVYNACGKYSLNQSASLVRQCLLLVTNDTGLMHIGAAFKKRIVSVWGNTVPQFGMYPYYGKTQNDGKPAALNEKWYKVEVEGLPCRPCSKLGYGQCPQRHFNCMNNISETEIAQLVASVSEKV